MGELTEAQRNQKVIDVTFKSTPQSFNNGWGWRIPGNPIRAAMQEKSSEVVAWTDDELEVMRMDEQKTPQQREVSRTRTYTYWAPFNYGNIKVELGRPGTGVEFNPDGAELDIYPYGAITIEEEEPIVGVTVIGSGCSAPSYVIIEAEPVVWKYPRTAVRMMRKDLWGVHVRGDAWFAGITENWNDAGLSSARFDLPESRKVIVGGGSNGGDPHYCIRLIRVDVKENV